VITSGSATAATAVAGSGTEPESSSGSYALPGGLSRANAELGCAAGARLLAAAGRPAPSADRLAEVLSSVVLPGRSSRHPVPGTGAEILVDSAIDRAGAAAALAEAYRCWGRVDHVLACLPDHKDVPGVIAALGGLPVTYVRMADRPRLKFTHEVPAAWSTTDVTELTPARLASRGTRLVALGTAYFTGRVLDLVDVPVDRLFQV
jgi:dihydrofolate synthase/folylpolyglutamate synthase